MRQYESGNLLKRHVASGRPAVDGNRRLRPRGERTLHRALQVDPRSQGSLLCWPWPIFAGNIGPKHARNYKRNWRIRPGDLDATYHLGFVDLQESKIDDAVKLFQQVIAVNPDYANAQYELGKILLDRGKLQEAVPHLEAAARLSPEKEYVHYQLQAAYRKESRTADADRELAVYQELKAKSRSAHSSADTKSIMRIAHPLLLETNQLSRSPSFFSAHNLLHAQGGPPSARRLRRRGPSPRSAAAAPYRNSKM